MCSKTLLLCNFLLKQYKKRNSLSCFHLWKHLNFKVGNEHFHVVKIVQTNVKPYASFKVSDPLICTTTVLSGGYVIWSELWLWMLLLLIANDNWVFSISWIIFFVYLPYYVKVHLFLLDLLIAALFSFSAICFQTMPRTVHYSVSRVQCFSISSERISEILFRAEGTNTYLNFVDK